MHVAELVVCGPLSSLARFGQAILLHPRRGKDEPPNLLGAGRMLRLGFIYPNHQISFAFSHSPFLSLHHILALCHHTLSHLLSPRVRGRRPLPAPSRRRRHFPSLPYLLLLWLSLLSVLPLAFSSDDRRSKLNQIFDSESSCQASPIGCFFSQSNWILILQDAPSIRLRDEQLVPFEAFAELRA